MKKPLLYVILGAAVLLTVLYYYNKYRVAPSVNFNELGLVDANGKAFDFNSLKGKKVIVSLYASWCGNCIDELEELNAIKDKELSDVEVVCITDESLEKLNSFTERSGYPFTFLKMQPSFPQIGVNSIPVNYILNTQLEIMKEEVGAIQWNDPSTLNHIKSLF